MTTRVELIAGPPSSGKTTITQNQFGHYERLNRDVMGGTVRALLPMMDSFLAQGKNVVLDNLFTTAAERIPFVQMAKKRGATVGCTFIEADINDCMANACRRMWKNHGRILSPDEIKSSKNPNDISPTPFFLYRKRVEVPTMDEGFDDVQIVDGWKWTPGPEYTNKAIIFDYDGTLRTSSGKYPLTTDDIDIFPGRKLIIDKYKNLGYILLGASNQSGIAKGELTEQDAHDCFQETNNQLGVDIEYNFCPHKVPPISCFCRKPQPGMGIYFIEKHKLDPSQCIMVGDQTTDKTFAARCGFKFIHTDIFFNA